MIGREGRAEKAQTAFLARGGRALREVADPEQGGAIEAAPGAAGHVQCCLGLWEMTAERTLNSSGKKKTIGVLGQSPGSRSQMAWGGRRREQPAAPEPP